MGLLGIDIGSTGCKTVAYTEEGVPSARAYREYKVGHCNSFAEISSEEVWNACQDCICQTVQQFHGEIGAISVSSMTDSFTPFNRSGQPLMNGIMSYDTRAEQECESISQHFDDWELYKTTGMPIHPMHPLSKILWIRNNRPEVFDQTWKYLSFEDFILWKLGADPCTSYSTAGATMLFDNTCRKWAPNILAYCSISEDVLPTVYPSGFQIGAISRKIAAATGLPKNAALVTGGFDQACCALSCGVLDQATLADTTGTNEIIFFVADNHQMQPLFENHFCASYHVDNVSLTSFGQIFNVGGSLKWYRELFYPNKQASYNKILNGIPENPTDLFYLPFLTGMGTPEMRHDLHGLLYGLTPSTNRHTLAKSILEGVTYELRYNIEYISSITGTDYSEICAAGGGARSDHWMQLKADITGREFSALKDYEAGTAGAAILAGIGSKIFKDTSEGYNIFRAKQARLLYTPRSFAHRDYGSRYDKYRELRARVTDFHF